MSCVIYNKKAISIVEEMFGSSPIYTAYYKSYFEGNIDNITVTENSSKEELDKHIDDFLIHLYNKSLKSGMPTVKNAGVEALKVIVEKTKNLEQLKAVARQLGNSKEIKNVYLENDWGSLNNIKFLKDKFNSFNINVEDSSIDKKQPSQIKEGVKELFESNPELANQVYEALGFGQEGNSQTTEAKKAAIERRRQEELKSEDSRIVISSELYQDSEDNYYKVQKLANGKTRVIIADENGKTLTHLDDYDASLTLDNILNGKEGQYGNRKGTTSELKINKIKDLKFTNKIVDKINAKYDAELKVLEKSTQSQITPQQKQKAQQLYSQYLDTIFPDSKVKDIVYHGSPNKEIQSFLSPEKEGYKKQETTTTGVAGIYFSNKKEVADLYQDFKKEGIKGKTYPAVINTQRPLVVGDKATDGFTEGTFGASALWNIQKGVLQGLRKAGIDSIKTGEYASKTSAVGENVEIAVFEPEQIHILGTDQDISKFKEFVDKENKQQSPEASSQEAVVGGEVKGSFLTNGLTTIEGLDKIDVKDAEVYTKQVFNEEESLKIFNYIQWLYDNYYDKDHKQSDKFGGARRSLYFSDTPYTYSGVTRPSNLGPENLGRLISKITKELGFIEGYFDMILINEYKDGSQKIGFHTDDEPILNNKGKLNPSVVTISFGDERTMVLQGNGVEYNIPMKSGMGLIMGRNGQTNYKHGINKEGSNSKRFSITLRHNAVKNNSVNREVVASGEVKGKESNVGATEDTVFNNGFNDEKINDEKIYEAFLYTLKTNESRRYIVAKRGDKYIVKNEAGQTKEFSEEDFNNLFKKTKEKYTKNPLLRAGVKPEEKGGNRRKDISMAELASQSKDGQFIGFPSILGKQTERDSSTFKYKQAWGDRANTGKYSSESEVMVSASGAFGRAGVSIAEQIVDIKKIFNESYMPLLDKATNAEATFYVGNQYAKGLTGPISKEKVDNWSEGGNIGDALVANYLQERGYIEINLGGYSKWIHPNKTGGSKGKKTVSIDDVFAANTDQKPIVYEQKAIAPYNVKNPSVIDLNSIIYSNYTGAGDKNIFNTLKNKGYVFFFPIYSKNADGTKVNLGIYMSSLDSEEKFSANSLYEFAVKSNPKIASELKTKEGFFKNMVVVHNDFLPKTDGKFKYIENNRAHGFKIDTKNGSPDLNEAVKNSKKGLESLLINKQSLRVLPIAKSLPSTGNITPQQMITMRSLDNRKSDQVLLTDNYDRRYEAKINGVSFRYDHSITEGLKKEGEDTSSIAPIHGYYGTMVHAIMEVMINNVSKAGNSYFKDSIMHDAMNNSLVKQALKEFNEFNNSDKNSLKFDVNIDEVAEDCYIALMKIVKANPNAIFMTEVPIGYRNEDKSWAGTIDLLIIHPDGTVSIIDYKTTTNPSNPDHFKYNSQLLVQAAALTVGNDTFDPIAIRGFNIIGFGKKYSNSSKTSMQRNSLQNVIVYDKIFFSDILSNTMYDDLFRKYSLNKDLVMAANKLNNSVLKEKKLSIINKYREIKFFNKENIATFEEELKNIKNEGC